jgi:hypothetical protein
VNDVLPKVRAQLGEYFAGLGLLGEPVSASVTFLGAESIEILRFGPDRDGVYHYASLGCSRHPMIEPTELLADPNQGPRAEVVLSLKGPTPTGLSQTIAVLAAAPAVEGLVLGPDALIDLETPLWIPSPFTAMLLGSSELDDVALPAPNEPVKLLSATPITPTEAAWVRLKGAEAMREAWRADGVDVLDPTRPAAQPR